MKLLRNTYSRLSVMLGAMALCLLGLGTKAQAALVAYDGTSITWDPTVVTEPLIVAIAAAAGAAAIVFVIVVGIRFIFRLVKGAR